MAEERKRTRDKGLRNVVNGAVNLAARPIISLLPTFLHARHLFGLYESDSKPVTRGRTACLEL